MMAELRVALRAADAGLIMVRFQLQVKILVDFR